MKVIGVTILLFFISSMFVSLFHMSHMDMQAGMSDCPFMSHAEVMCPMKLLDHVSAWKTAFLSVVPELTLLLVAIGFGVLLASVAPNLLRRIVYVSTQVSQQILQRIYTFVYRPLQELFSRGILNPKLY